MVDVLTAKSVSAGDRKGKESDKNPDGKPSPTPLEFALVFNDSESRKEVVQRLVDAGFHMTYGAAVQREKNYTNPDRNGGPLALKEMKRASRTSTQNVQEINAALAKAAEATASV